MTYKKLNYNSIMEMKKERDICGYLRNPITNGKTLRGKCALDDRNCRCKHEDSKDCNRANTYFLVIKMFDGFI